MGTSLASSHALTTPGRKKRERGVLLRYLQHTSGYSRAQVTRLVRRWQRHRLSEFPLAKRYLFVMVHTLLRKACPSGKLA